ncbi:MAG TPA: hypothetical protein VGP07_25530 [Polyangia bacterium]|jgi:hypothetical protein
MFKLGTLQSTVLISAMVAAAAAGCRKADDDDASQIGSAVGEVMASVDEANQGGMATAMLPALPILRTPDELRGPLWRRAIDSVFPSAQAAACADFHFSACDAGTRIRTFSACSIGLATLDGAVSLAFSSNPLCALASPGDAVTRTGDFTLTGLYGGTLTVSAPAGGQTLTRTSSGFEYTVGGMERVLKGAGGRTLFDISTETTTPIELTGSSRADLVIVSGALKITHHLAGYAVTLTPSNLAWSAQCTCAVSGSLSGSVSGGKHDGKEATMTLMGCGDADVTIDGVTESVTLDRCTAI